MKTFKLNDGYSLIYGMSASEKGVAVYHIMNNDFGDKYLPDLYIEETSDGYMVSIQTTSYGSLHYDELQKVMEGYRMAMEASRIAEYILLDQENK